MEATACGTDLAHRAFCDLRARHLIFWRVAIASLGFISEPKAIDLRCICLRAHLPDTKFPLCVVGNPKEGHARYGLDQRTLGQPCPGRS